MDIAPIWSFVGLKVTLDWASDLMYMFSYQVLYVCKFIDFIEKNA